MDVGQAVLPTIQTEKCRLRIQVYNGCSLSLLAVANSPNRLTIVALLAPLTECEHQRFQYAPRFCWVPLGRCWPLLTKKLSTYRLGDTGRGVLLYCTLTGTITGSHCFPCTHSDTAIIPKSSDIREYQGFLTTVNEPNKRFNYVSKDESSNICSNCKRELACASIYRGGS
jgi:hypothetical protein